MADKPKNKAAQEMAHARWAKTTPEERKEYAKKLVAAKAAKRNEHVCTDECTKAIDKEIEMTIEDALKIGHARFVKFMDRPNIGYVFTENGDNWRTITRAKSLSTPRGLRWEAICERMVDAQGSGAKEGCNENPCNAGLLVRRPSSGLDHQSQGRLR